MTFSSIASFLDRSRRSLARGPVAVIFAEDGVEVGSTVEHHLDLGFRQIVLLRPEGLPIDVAADMPDVADVIFDFSPRNAVPEALNRLIAAAEGSWLYWGYNAEYLFFPFCETRRVGEMLAFHAEERRAAMVAYVIDLYAADPERHPDGVDRAGAMFDRSGYFAAERYRDGVPLERQVDIFGGLRWRYEEHIPWARRRLDRVALFRATRGLTMRPDFTLSDEEMNTLSCPWHHNLTAAVASFRTAKALKSNPGSRLAIRDFRWSGSQRFEWTSRQLLEAGFMEPGQWF